ncbi:rnhA operon protein [Halobacteria archaeon AArc-dxtr1]|nr:rnhA operon protein [Halobacteria archaeon AArc-dxtr1]
MRDATEGGEPEDGVDADESTTSTDGSTLPDDAVEEVERLTRLARAVADPAESEQYRDHRDDLLDRHEFAARIREDDGGDVLVCHPAEWRDGDVIRTDRIEDLSRAIEIPLEGTENPDDWTAVDRENRTLVEAVRDEHGEIHGDNAAALADFFGNHYAKPIESATAAELAEFRTEYFVRNAWPSARQRETIDRSIALVYETAGKRVPEYQ